MYWVVLVAFFASLGCLQLLLSRLRTLALDQPNERSLHQQPVPRTGGLAILAGAGISLAFGSAPLWMPMLIAVALGAVSFVDDVRGIGAGLRLAAHFLGATLVVVFLLRHSDAVSILVLVLAVTWITNLYNFMDGSDGLAGGMTVIGFGVYAAGAYAAHEFPLAILCSSISASAVAFLLFNFHPARIFLGDVGSIPLGFLAGALGIAGWRHGAWPLWFPVLVFGPFIGDATLTLARRLVRGERAWEPHRDHYYQRLVRMGFGHRGTAFVSYAAMGFCAVASLFGRQLTEVGQGLVFISASLVLAAIAVWIDLRWRRHCRNPSTAA